MTAKHLDLGDLATAAWMQPDAPDVACATNPEAWRLSNGRTVRHDDPAMVTCRACPVRLGCLEWALEHNERGIWGATSDADRVRMKDGAA